MKKLLLLALALVASFSLMACREIEEQIDPELTDLEKVEDAAGRLNALFPTRGETTGNLTLPTTMIHGVTVSWTSANPSVISNEGRVVRPAAGSTPVNVTMTATLTLNDVTESRHINFTVLPWPAGLIFSDDFGELHSTARLNDTILVEGVVVHMFQAGYFLYDGKDYLSVYNPNHSTVSLGDLVQVAGSYSVYNTLYQVGNVTSEEVLSSEHDYTTPVEEMSIADINALDTAANRLIPGRTYKTEGYLELRGTYDNVYIVDGTETLLVYYLSLADSITALEDKVGEFVELEIIYYTDHSRDGVLVVFEGGAADITVIDLDDEAMVTRAINALESEDIYTMGADIDLPATGMFDVAFSGWTSSDTEVFANDGTFIDHPGAPTIITFTGTATLGTYSAPVTLTVELDMMDPMDYADVIALVDGEDVYIEGIIYEIIDANSGFFMHDGAGKYLYVRDTTIYGELDYAVGDVIVIAGVKDSYRGIPQITDITFHAESDTVIAMPTSLGLVAIADIVAGVYPAGSIVEISGIATVIEGFYDDYRVYDGDDFVQIHHNSDNAVFGDFDGMLVTATVTVFQWDYSTPYVTFFGDADDITLGAMSDADKLALALADLELPVADPDMVMEDIDLPSEGLYDATITWVSSDETVITNEGVITRGADDETVTLTATVTVGAETDTKIFTIIVKDELFVVGGISVADALLEADGEIVDIEAVVVGYPGLSWMSGYFIQDSDGTAIYVEDDLTDVEIGNKIIVRGELDTNTGYGNEQRMLINGILLQNDEGDHDITVITDKSLQDIIDEYPATSSMRFRVENVKVIGFGFNAYTLESGDTEIDFIFDTRAYGQHLLDLIEIGDTIPWIEFNVLDIYFGDIRMESVLLPELTEIYVETLAEDRMGISKTATEDITLPDELSIAGVDYSRGPDVFAVTWSTDNADVITAEGVVTRPAIGELDETVTLTAHIVFSDTVTIEVAFVVTVPAEQADEPVLAYETGFEADEDFTAGTVYNNTTIKYDGPAEQQWGTYYGTASTTGPISGAMSMQMRWYTGAVDNLGYTFTNFDIEDVHTVTFFATSTNGLNVTVSYSTDGGTTWIGDETFDLTGTSTEYSYVIEAEGSIRVRFMISLPDPIPGSNSQLRIDDVKIYQTEQAVEPTYATGFEGATAKTSYATGTITDDGVEWELSEALRGSLDGDKKVGDWSIRGRADGYARILNPFEGLSTIEFMFAHYGTLTEGELSVEISTDAGTTWVEVWAMPAGTYGSLELVTIDLDYTALGVDATDEFLVQWIFGGTVGNDSRMNIDEVKLFTTTD